MIGGLLGVLVGSGATPAPAELPGAAEPTTVLVADAAAGAAKAMACAGCHGADGNAIAPIWPHLAQQQFVYIVKQLTDFRGGRRVDPMMSGLAATLTDQDVVNLAAHFSRQELRAGPAHVAAALEGERLYTLGRTIDAVPPCAGCHGLRGEGFDGGFDGGFPAIAGQNPDYVTKQLQSFRSGTRSNDWGEMMRYVASRLTDDDIAALSRYLAGLRRPRGVGPDQADLLVQR